MSAPAFGVCAAGVMAGNAGGPAVKLFCRGWCGRPPYDRGMRALVFAPCVLLAAELGLLGCGSPTLLQCRAEAAAHLPLEPDQVTLGDVREVVRKVRACQAGTPAPAGDPPPGDAGP